MRKITVIILLFIALLGCTKSPEDRLMTVYQEGLEELQNYNLDAADAKFEEMLEINDTSTTALVGQALVQEAKLQFYDAIDTYLFILTKTSGNEEVYKGLFRCYTTLGFPHEAFEIAVEYDKIFIDNPDAIYLLSLGYRNLQETTRARNYIQELSSYDFDQATIDFISAYTFYKEGTLDSSEFYASEGISNIEDSELGLKYAADYYEEIGAIDSAVNYSSEYYQANKNNLFEVYSHFQRLIRNNYFADARALISELETMNADSLTVVGCKLFLALEEDNRSLIRFYGQKYKALEPTSLTGVAYTMLSSAPIDDNLTMSQDLKAVKAYYNGGKYGVEFGDFYVYAMTLSYVSDDKSPGSLDYLMEIGGIRRNRMKLRMMIAEVKHIIGMFDECFRDLEMNEKAHQMDPIWLTEIGNVYGHYAVRKYEEAFERYEKALEYLPSYKPAFESYLAKLEKIGRYDDALKLFDRYPFFEQNNYQVAFEKTKYYFLAGQYKKGIEQFSSYFPFVSGDIEFLENQLTYLSKMSKEDIHAELLSVATNINQDNVELKLILAAEANMQNDYQRAEQLVDEILQVEPDNAVANAYKARSLYYNGQKTEAYDMFEANKLKFHNDPVNLLIYSHILAVEGIDYSKAANIARQAVFEGYGEYEYVLNLSQIYFKMGRFDLAFGEASKASFTEKTAPLPYYLMGISRFNQDKDKFKEQIKENLNKAIDFGISGERLKEAQNILKQV